MAEDCSSDRGASSSLDLDDSAGHLSLLAVALDLDSLGLHMLLQNLFLLLSQLAKDVVDVDWVFLVESVHDLLEGFELIDLEHWSLKQVHGDA